ncbi:hypothetical protein HHK36_028319 [Tetracentron sinense]|uniref:Uncharacterized protein n=1 Tax=Tetracentron sinense TaxID=13715 RepID=A0A834YI89_TETSI|nr:hypothetical protein HHK36_028319 [Tetracentron sinense]
MASNNKPKKPILHSQTKTNLSTTLFFIVLFTIPALLLLHTPLTSTCTTSSTLAQPWSGNLRNAQFAWNRLPFIDSYVPPTTLKIAVFSRKWPLGATPGGMERHAMTLHSALARRGHEVHVYTSPPPASTDGAALSKEFTNPPRNSTKTPQIHYHDGEPGRWRYNLAWSQFEAENQREPFDVVHTESVALPHWLARNLPNLAVSWHGIALESLQSDIYQDLARRPNESMSPAFNKNLQGVVPKVLNEIRFFKNYAHHVAISDSCGEMLRDVYQIPKDRVHVILNGVDEEDFGHDVRLGHEFRTKVGVPQNASIVLGVAGRLVKDKGHPLLHEAFSKLITKHPEVYLIVAGSGPWEQRYRDLGPQVIVLGSMRPTELKAFYNSIDIFVNPTLRPQGLDLTLMEAMMSGKPVLASRFPSIKGTIVVDDEFGYMFSPNVESLSEALEAMVGEGSERLARRGRACRDYAASMFTAGKMALAYERLFLCIKNEAFFKVANHGLIKRMVTNAETQRELKTKHEQYVGGHDADSTQRRENVEGFSVFSTVDGELGVDEGDLGVDEEEVIVLGNRRENNRSRVATEVQWRDCGSGSGKRISVVYQEGLWSNRTAGGKGEEPVFSVIFSSFLGDSYPLSVWLSILPIVLGCSLTAVTEVSFNLQGLWGALISNVGFVLRNIYSKRSLQSFKEVNGLNLYGRISIISLLYLFPMAVFVEGSYWIEGYRRAIEGAGKSSTLYLWVILSGVFYHLYNQSSYQALDQISPLTFFVGNTMKRVVVIISIVLVLRNPVRPLNALGSAIAIFGTFLYS